MIRKILLAGLLTSLMTPALEGESLLLRAGLTSSDLFRGIRFFEGSPADLGLEWQSDRGFFAGALVSASVEGLEDREHDFYLGWSWQKTPEQRVSLAAYRFTFSGASSIFDFTELDLLWESARWTAELAFSPEIYGTDGSGLYGALSHRIPLPRDLSLDVYAGYYAFLDSQASFYEGAPKGYFHYGVGVAWPHREFLFSITWSNTGSDADLLYGEESGGSRVVASIRFGRELWSRSQARGGSDLIRNRRR